MKLSKRLADEKAYVAAKLGTATICTRCGATLATYADKCSADLSEQCEGFHRIEAAKQDFKAGAPLPKRTGAQLIADERARQVSAEGWTADHDDEHGNRELLKAAICYARHAGRGALHNIIRSEPSDWPWESNWWKPSFDPIRNLVKAGALIAAEIDRLQRKESPRL